MEPPALTRLEIARYETASFLRRRWGWIVLVAISASLIGIAATNAEDGLFGQVTAAWIQGIGSVAAIIGAIWIDHGSARRREEEQSRQEFKAREARLAAIEYCVVVIRNAKDRVQYVGGRAGASGLIDFPQTARREIEAGHAALAFHLRQPAELQVRVLGAVALAERVMSDLRDFVSEKGMIPADRCLTTLDDADRAIQGVQYDYQISESGWHQFELPALHRDP